MKRIRALVVDDSVVVRRMVREALSSDPDVEVAGVAANGRIAVSMVDQLSPDVITLDIEMPEMNGLDALAAIRAKHPRLPIIMFSTLTERGAVATLEALANGASDYVTKPANVGSISAGLDRIRQDLLPKVKALCGVRPSASPSARVAALPKPSIAVPRSPAKIAAAATAPTQVVAIGTSTGGPNALAEVLPAIPADFPVPIVIVQHMPPTFTRFLAERLSHECSIEVTEAKPGDELTAGHAWIAPGDFHMVVAREGGRVRIHTNRDAHENSCRPSVDVLFRSVAKLYGPTTLAVVMTGMGQDGSRGAEMIRERGGDIVVQDEATSVVWGMPGYIAQAGLANAVLPLKLIGPEIVRRVMSSRRESAKESAKSQWV